MHNHKRKTLAVIGAGPKGIAVAVKAKVMAEFGFPVDHVILIEKNGIGAHWSGDFGYTNGEMKLGTSPEKDVVFPLETNVGDKQINAQIHQRLLQFTWTSFLVQTNRYSDWVDRGRHTPCHKLWAKYLHWISEQLAPEVTIISAEVVQIDLPTNHDRWVLTISNSRLAKTNVLYVDRLMLTGPGKSRTDFIETNSTLLPPSTYDLESFWNALKTKKFSAAGRLAVVGAGENAASALLALSQYAPKLQVDVISPNGFIFSRSESYYENQMYSQPEKMGWTKLNLLNRLDFIKRTDLGVFSQQAMTILSEQVQHRIITGRVIQLLHDGHAILLKLANEEHFSDHVFDQVILATGFDHSKALNSLFTPAAIKRLTQAIDAPLNDQSIAIKIQSDLSVQNLKPILHLPMLAGLNQGPGFANLSCLGLLSDRIVLQSISNKSNDKVPIFLETVE